MPRTNRTGTDSLEETTQLPATDAGRRGRQEPLISEQGEAEFYGELVLEILGPNISLKTFEKFLRKVVERLEDDPELKAQWTVSGAEYLRRRHN